MKKKMIENLTPPENKKKKVEWYTILQWIGQIVIFNIYIGAHLICRHCFDTEKKEFATYYPDGNRWTNEKIERCYGEDPTYGYFCGWSSETRERMRNISKEDVKQLRARLPERTRSSWRARESVFGEVSELEMEYGQDRRENTERNRVAKVGATMAKVPPIPAGTLSWIDKVETGHEDVCLKVRDKDMWSCSACGGMFEKSKLINAKSKKAAKDREMIVCPQCGKAIRLYTRKRRVESTPHFSMIQPIDDEISVARHFAADICCMPGKKKEILIVEEVRIVLFKNKPMEEKQKTCSIYYEQYTRPSLISDDAIAIPYAGNFDNKSNPANKREYAGYLYDGGIEEAFKQTVYEPWTRLFKELSAAGLKLNYNAMMCGVREKNYIHLMEMLFRGRFNHLLSEESERISYWDCRYYGNMRLNGNCIEDVFGIDDRQKINRIRDKDGGNLMIVWMRWCEENGKKLSDKALTWLMDAYLTPDDMKWTEGRFTIEQGMNYLIRQKKESYPTRTFKGIIEQYRDYMAMCKRLKKDTQDEMVYRPRELKRRHDEAVEEIRIREDEIKAEEYSERYGEAEHVLKEIKSKFEYRGENYFIMVPDRIVDIVKEGRKLHHCVGSTDRYFDRIKQHETYICFLRKTDKPSEPYYTVEVEPGGTIRQHRGYMDEETEFDEVKPFLKEWQKEIRKRMSTEDHKRAAVSKTKREENIEELKRKNNTRVLEGLRQDFMEAV